MKFSVIIPLYNKSAFLGKALNSVLSQTYKDYECIIVDDGSTDGSEKIADSYSAKYKNITVIHQFNSGVATARNNGVKVSSGEYVCFLDADDWWEDDFLYVVNDIIIKIPNAGIYGTNYYYFKNNKGHLRLDIKTGVFDYFNEYSKRLQMPLTSSSVCMPKNIFNEMSGFNPKLKLGEDFDLWVRIALKYPTVFINKPLAYYNQDIPVNQRAVGNLISPENHFLWNLNYLRNVEENNKDVKFLIDSLRVSNMLFYYASNLYHDKSKHILECVNWSKQSFHNKLYYKLPVSLARLHNCIYRLGSVIKQNMKN